MLIFERGPIEIGNSRLPYSMAPNLVFLQFLRAPDLYLKKLAELGFSAIEHRRLALEMGFNLIVARIGLTPLRMAARQAAAIGPGSVST